MNIKRFLNKIIFMAIAMNIVTVMAFCSDDDGDVTMKESPIAPFTECSPSANLT